MRSYKATKFRQPKIKGESFESYGIDELIPSITANTAGHIRKIVVYGDVRLRNKILRLLNAATMKN